MTETDRRPDTGSPPPSRSNRARMLRRYGPFAALVAIVAVVALVATVFGGDDDGGGEQDGVVVKDREELIRSGPMTPEKAELLGRENVDFGPNCDTELGRIAIPTVYAPPCVAPFEGDNGGATSQGVTGDEILIVRYSADPRLDPLLASQIQGTGAEVAPETAIQTAEDYVDLYEQYFETYGRSVRIESYTGTGPSADVAAAKADAIAIADKQPFAVLGGPAQSSKVFADELSSRGVVCLGNCSLALPESFARERSPYLWGNGPSPSQAARLVAEMVGNLAPPGKAEFAGDPDLREQDRVYGVIHYDNADGDQTEAYDVLVDGLKERDIEVETDAEFFLDLAEIQENARTIITKMKNADVTTIIFTGDPITPANFTKEATAQEYSPEWILGQSYLADTAVFARTYDPDQWKNGFGIQLIPGRGEQETQDAFLLYEWGYGTEPPNNTYGVIEPEIRLAFTGIHLAGPNLTPEAFRDGLFRFPPSGGGPTNPTLSRGEHGLWPYTDLWGTDDAAIIWWDPEAEGENEIGQNGSGLYRAADGGRRYKLGEWPSPEASGLFDVESSVTIHQELPPGDEPPEYPSPAG